MKIAFEYFHFLGKANGKSVRSDPATECKNVFHSSAKRLLTTPFIFNEVATYQVGLLITTLRYSFFYYFPDNYTTNVFL